MSEPEIARRCPSCGASIRAPAMFCPQCGKSLANQHPAAHVASAPRDANEEDPLRGVGKLRQISSVVIDEAAYDPSLRFVLVAAALFVLFLGILLLSELIA